MKDNSSFQSQALDGKLNVMKYLVAALFILFLLPKTVSASLVEVSDDGGVTVNVLSYEDSLLVEETDIEVKRIASEENKTTSNISISKTGEKVSMRVGVDKNFDVTNIKDDLVEVEARPDTKKVKVSYDGNAFLITEESITASTTLPIVIDPVSGKFLLETGEGRKFLGVLPQEAAKSILKTKIINKVAKKPIKIVDENGKLSYLIDGEKVVSLFEFYDFRLPISTRISATTGEIESIEAPEWLKFISVIFV